jgi:hypothetical protein
LLEFCLEICNCRLIRSFAGILGAPTYLSARATACIV